MKRNRRQAAAASTPATNGHMGRPNGRGAGPRAERIGHGGEPPHVHVDRDARSAKFWLLPVALARNLGFSPRELSQIEALIQQHRQALVEAWNEHFGP